MENEIKRLRRKFCMFSSLISLFAIIAMLLILNLMIIFINRQELQNAVETVKLTAMNSLADIDTETIDVNKLEMNETGDKIVMRNPRLIESVSIHGSITCDDPDADWYCIGAGIFFEMPDDNDGYYLIQKEYEFHQGNNAVTIDFTRNDDWKYNGENVDADIADAKEDMFLLTPVWWAGLSSDSLNAKEHVKFNIENIYIKYKRPVTPVESYNYQMITRDFKALYEDIPPIFDNFHCFYGIMDKTGSVIEVNRGNLPESVSYDEIIPVVGDKEDIKLSGLKYSYNSENAGDYQLNIFVSNITADKSKHRIMSVSVLSGIVIYIFLLVLIYIISGKAVKPILESNEKQKQFISNASHELKTPLTVILSASELMEKKNGADSLTATVKAQSEKMSKLINDMLSLSRLSKQTDSKNNFKAFDLSHALSNTALYFESLAYEKQKALHTDIQENIEFNGIPERIDELTGILIENAIKYADADSAIEISLSRKNKAVVLECSNKCSDFRQESLPYLFERFYRGDTSHSDKISGYGLGLSIAKEIVGIHGGAINAAYRNGIFSITVKFE